MRRDRVLVSKYLMQMKLKEDCMFSSYIRFEDIIRISTEGVEKNCIQIITINGKFIKRKSLSQMKSLLPHSFIQIENILYLMMQK